MGVITKINCGKKEIHVSCPSFLYEKHKKKIIPLKEACEGSSEKTQVEIEEMIKELKETERVEVEIIGE